jgi:hypothetical protein
MSALQGFLIALCAQKATVCMMLQQHTTTQIEFLPIVYRLKFQQALFAGLLDDDGRIVIP